MIRARAGGRTARAILLAALCLCIFASSCQAFDLTPENPQPGQEITLPGTASPGEDVSFQSSFSMNLPVAGGQYEYETSVQVPQKPNRFTVTASNVEEFNAGIKIGIWITKGFTPSGGSVRLSQADVPPGSYHLKVFGKALSGAASVPVAVEAETTVKADSSGRYELIIDTTGIPAGEYRIQGGGESKTISLGGSGSTSSGTSVGTSAGAGDARAANAGSSSASGSAEQAEDTASQGAGAKAIGVNRETVLWYADLVGLEVKNSSQYDEAEEKLRNRLSGGYWKIIGRGEPLTEEAGNCMQEYCLVRGTDACTVCRQKDIILKGGNTSDTGLQGKALSAVSSNVAGLSKQQPANESREKEQKGFFSSASEWLNGLLSMFGWL